MFMKMLDEIFVKNLDILIVSIICFLIIIYLVFTYNIEVRIFLISTSLILMTCLFCFSKNITKNEKLLSFLVFSLTIVYFLTNFCRPLQETPIEGGKDVYGSVAFIKVYSDLIKPSLGFFLLVLIILIVGIKMFLRE